MTGGAPHVLRPAIPQCEARPGLDEAPELAGEDAGRQHADPETAAADAALRWLAAREHAAACPPIHRGVARAATTPLAVDGYVYSVGYGLAYIDADLAEEDARDVAAEDAGAALVAALDTLGEPVTLGRWEVRVGPHGRPVALRRDAGRPRAERGPRCR